jgi:hypothetical protein
MKVIGEVVYVGMFGIYGLFATVLYVANSELAISWMPRWPGFAGGIHGTSQTIGSLFIPQLVIWLRMWFNNSHINLGTIFFCLGIVKIADMTVISHWEQAQEMRLQCKLCGIAGFGCLQWHVSLHSCHFLV